MARPTWLIQYEGGQGGMYRFGQIRADRAMAEVPAADPTSPDALVAALADAGYHGEPTMLAVPSQWCLPAAVTMASRRMARNRQAVSYAVEERLPLSAEDMVCDFVVRDTGAFGVAADTLTLLPVVRGLERAGIAILTITPTATLLLERLASLHGLPSDGVVLLASEDHCDLFVFARSTPRQWCYLPSDAEIVTRELAASLLMQGDETVLPVTAVNVTAEMAAALGSLEPEIAISRQELDNDRAVLAEAAEVLARGKRPWIELRRGPIGQYDPYGLMRGSIRFLVFALLVTTMAFAAVAWTRAEKCELVADSLNTQKRAVFQRLFPEARVPTGIRSRLQSERRKLSGMSALPDGTPELTSITGFFLDALGALPKDLRFRLLDMEFEEEAGQLDGEVRRHGDVDVIASSLRSHGFDVAPPHTDQRASGTIRYTLSVSMRTSSEERKQGVR